MMNITLLEMLRPELAFPYRTDKLPTDESGVNVKLFTPSSGTASRISVNGILEEQAIILLAKQVYHVERHHNNAPKLTQNRLSPASSTEDRMNAIAGDGCLLHGQTGYLGRYRAAMLRFISAGSDL